MVHRSAFAEPEAMAGQLIGRTAHNAAIVRLAARTSRHESVDGAIPSPGVTQLSEGT
jgi:hypothetical protein